MLKTSFSTGTQLDDTKPSKIKRFGKLVLLTGVFVILLPLLTFGLSRIFDISDINSANNTIDNLFFPLFLLRAVIYISIYIFYKPLTTFISRRQNFTENQTAMLLERKTHTVSLLIVMEVIITFTMLMRIT